VAKSCHRRDLPEPAAVKTLYLVRHAKSESAEAVLDDFDRPLDLQGREAAASMGSYMQAAGIRPDLVLCSSAVRARETCAAMATRFDEAAVVEFERSLYLAGADNLLRRLRALSGPVASVMLIGHNPGLQGLALRLAGSEAALATLHARYPPAALAELTFPIAAWCDLTERSGRLERFVSPQTLTAGP
jgi:phosphohistidine phosphatase